MTPISAQKLMQGLWHTAPEDLLLNGVVTDNREVTPGCVFVAIEGERVDGHSFAADAFKRGAALLLGSHPVEGVPADRTVTAPNILSALITMGANYRDAFNPLILGVTGSVGKTTTKEFCGAVFAAFDKTLVTEGNQNNEIGLPKTLFRLDGETRYAVLEMGMQQRGEIRELSIAARPDAAIITKIGTSHIEHLGSIENILAAKLEICDGLAVGAPLVLNGDDPLLRAGAVPETVRPVYVSLSDESCDVLAKDIIPEGTGQYFTISDKQFGEYKVYIPTMGRHTVTDALLAYTAATRLGLNPSQSAAALSAYKPAGMRQKVVKAGDVTVIEDCYNANPDSMAAALAALGEYPTKGKRIAVLGDMKELGHTAEAAHRTVAAQCKAAGVEVLIAVGALAALAAEEAAKLGIDATVCETNPEAAGVLAGAAQPGDVVLVKASRGMAFEEILGEYYALSS